MAKQGLFREFWLFLKETKKWWLTPIIVILLLLAIFILFADKLVLPLLYI